MGLRKGIAVFAGAAAIATGVVLGLPGADADASGKELSHKAAAAKLRAANITWTSSGGCGDRNKPTCTSFSQIKSGTVNGIITLKKASGCKVTITGGTETGHASGTYSHWNGYKVDISPTACVTRYIKNTFRAIGGNQWKSRAGNLYYDEGDHWDITYY
jgi:hypothetical protein